MKKLIIGIIGGVFIISISLVFAASKVFPDVPENVWYADAVKFLKEKGITAGFPDGTFRPNSKVTRAEMAVMLDKTLSYVITKDWETYTTIKEYDNIAFKYPSEWKAVDQHESIELEENASPFEWVVFEDIVSKKEVAILNCPGPETGFEAWNFEKSSRTFTKNGKTYVVELWLGNPIKEAVGINPLNLIFVHRGTELPFCYLSSTDDFYDDEMFRMIYNSVY